MTSQAHDRGVRSHQVRTVARVLAAGFLIAGCTAGSGAPTPTTFAPSASAAPPSVVAPSSPTPAVPTASVELTTTYTDDDASIATLILTVSEEAIPQLKGLNRSDPSTLEALFLPLGEWIAAQRTAIGGYAPSTCTEAAVELFHDGLDQYDDIREKFMAWRDWGANGHAFPPGAPNVAVAAFEEARVELDAHCPSP